MVKEDACELTITVDGFSYVPYVPAGFIVLCGFSRSSQKCVRSFH
jgi:hypothetical protein